MSSPESCKILIERVDGHWFASAEGYGGHFGLFAGATPSAALQELFACAKSMRLNYPSNPLLRDIAEMAVAPAGKED